MAAPAKFPGPLSGVGSLHSSDVTSLGGFPSTGGSTAGGSEPVRVCGVPEHFNVPWRRAAAAFRREGVDARWKEIRGGTGEMIEQIRSGAQDVAVALTEGIMSAVASSMGSAQPLRYAGGFVMSPLMWMVATGYERAREGGDAQTLAQIASKDKIRVAISRLGSGSHLMAYLLAQREGWPFEKLVFITRGDFFKIRASVRDNTADIFLWEWAMTAPFVSPAKEVWALGRFLTPWSSFGFVVRESWLNDEVNRVALKKIAGVAFKEAAAFMRDPDSARREIMASFNTARDETDTWLSCTRYCAPIEMVLDSGHTVTHPLVANAPMLRLVLRSLVAVGQIPDKTNGAPWLASAAGYDLSNIVDTRVAQLVGFHSLPPPLCAAETDKNGRPASVAEGTSDPSVRPWWESLQPSICAPPVLSSPGLGGGGRHRGSSVGGRRGSSGGTSAGYATSGRESPAETEGGGLTSITIPADSNASSAAPNSAFGESPKIRPQTIAVQSNGIAVKPEVRLKETADALSEVLAHLNIYGGAAGTPAAPMADSQIVPAKVLKPWDGTYCDWG